MNIIKKYKNIISSKNEEIRQDEKGFDCMETKAYLIEFYLNEVLKKFKFN